MLGWLTYVAGAVAPQIMAGFGMSFPFYVTIAIVSIAVGALGAVAAGAADRFGRVTIVVAGLTLSSLLVLFALPSAGGRISYLLLTAVTGLVEGAAGVALPALVRDFSPQVNRATAMGMWSLGPVGGSLLVTGVATLTLDAHPDWRFQFRVAGTVGLAVAAVAAVALRELSPGLRNQVLVGRRDLALAHQRAAAAADARPSWRSVLGLDVLGSAVGISVYLMFYYVLVGFFVVYLSTTYGYTGSRANGVANLYWAVSAAALLGAGAVSDRLRVRKPLMVAGALISALASGWIAVRSVGAAPSHASLLGIVALAAVGNGLVFAPWLAAFSETVERHNPAATATGLAAWAAVNKFVITAVLVGFMAAVTAPTILVDDGPRVQAIAAAHPAAVATVAAGKPVPTQDAPAAADLAFLRAHLDDLTRAGEQAPGQWRRWWWICAAAQLAFLASVPLLAGRWRPRSARADQQEHDRRITAALSESRQSGRRSSSQARR